MDVIRHDHIPSDCHVKLLHSSNRIFAECFVCDEQTIDLASVNGADRYKIKGRSVRLKYLFKPRRPIFDHTAIVDAAVRAAMFGACGRHARLYTGIVTRSKLVSSLAGSTCRFCISAGTRKNSPAAKVTSPHSNFPLRQAPMANWPADT